MLEKTLQNLAFYNNIRVISDTTILPKLSEMKARPTDCVTFSCQMLSIVSLFVEFRKFREPQRVRDKMNCKYIINN